MTVIVSHIKNDTVMAIDPCLGVMNFSLQQPYYIDPTTDMLLKYSVHPCIIIYTYEYLG